MIVTDNESAIIKPGMACVVVRVVLFCLSLVYENRLYFHCSTVKFNVPVELDACDNDNRWVYWAERHLLNRLILRKVWDNLKRAYAALFFPVPDGNTRFRLGADRHEKPLILWAEVS